MKGFIVPCENGYGVQILLFAMVVLSGLNAYGQEESWGLTWEFAKLTRDIHGRELQEKITYFISSERTKVDYEHESIYIDYAKQFLYRYNKAGNSCLRFPLISSNGTNSTRTKDVSKKRNFSLIGSMRVFTTAEHKVVARYDCSVKHILFGAGLAMHQMASPLMVSVFGQEFTESMVGYCVSNDFVGLDILCNIAQKRDDIFENNPLLRQVDIIGLLEILGGFPMQITHQSDGASVITLLSPPLQIDDMTRFQLPGACEK